MVPRSIAAFAAFALLAFTGVARADKWLKIMPNDPFSKDGSFHQFDIDSGFEDETTGFVAARMIFAKPEESAKTDKWYVWAFDCKGSVYFVSSPGDAAGTSTQEGWRGKPSSLAKPQMGGVTNMFGKKLCALKGSWPKGALP